MTVPGSNLLAQALTLIAGQTVGYVACTGRTKSATGQWVDAYANPIPKRGSFQPVPRQYYLQMGLDYNKEYCNWYDPTAIVRDVQVDRAPDKINFGGFVWTALSSNDWSAVDGWQGTLFVKGKPL
jgi:hypothetical protein